MRGRGPMRDPPPVCWGVADLGIADGTRPATMAESLGVNLAELQTVLNGVAPMPPGPRNRTGACRGRRRGLLAADAGDPRPRPRAAAPRATGFKTDAAGESVAMPPPARCSLQARHIVRGAAGQMRFAFVVGGVRREYVRPRSRSRCPESAQPVRFAPTKRSNRDRSRIPIASTLTLGS